MSTSGNNNIQFTASALGATIGTFIATMEMQQKTSEWNNELSTYQETAIASSAKASADGQLNAKKHEADVLEQASNAAIGSAVSQGVAFASHAGGSVASKLNPEIGARLETASQARSNLQSYKAKGTGLGGGTVATALTKEHNDFINHGIVPEKFLTKGNEGAYKSFIEEIGSGSNWDLAMKTHTERHDSAVKEYGNMHSSVQGFTQAISTGSNTVATGVQSYTEHAKAEITAEQGKDQAQSTIAQAMNQQQQGIAAKTAERAKTEREAAANTLQMLETLARSNKVQV